VRRFGDANLFLSKDNCHINYTKKYRMSLITFRKNIKYQKIVAKSDSSMTHRIRLHQIFSTSWLATLLPPPPQDPKTGTQPSFNRLRKVAHASPFYRRKAAHASNFKRGTNHQRLRPAKRNLLPLCKNRPKSRNYRIKTRAERLSSHLTHSSFYTKKPVLHQRRITSLFWAKKL
jgi:hypothetical protein